MLAGPSVGMYFAEKGAKVLKVENKRTKGDVTRSWKLPVEDKNSPISAYFCSVNWGKKYLQLDLHEPAELEHLKNEIKSADILITNFKSGDADKYGLDFKSVVKLNPTLILGEISGFGADSDRVAYDLILQAESGMMSINGTETSGPVKMPIAFIDLFAGHQLKEGLLEALLERAKRKTAYHVEVSLFDAALTSLANQASNYLMTGQIPERMGSKHPNIAPYGEMFTTHDNKLITFGIGNDRQFEKLCNYLELEIRPEFETNQKRLENRSELQHILQTHIAHKKSKELINKLIEYKVPVAEIKSIDQVLNAEEVKDLILEEDIQNIPTKRLRTIAYKIKAHI